MFRVTRTKFEKDNTASGGSIGYRLRQCWTVPRSQTTFGYLAVWFIFIRRMPFLVPTLDITDPLFALGITSGLYPCASRWPEPSGSL